jgi:hypothetical protein
VSAGSEQLCMQMPSAPRGRERISMVSGKIEEVSNRFAASPEAVRIAQYWACPPNESHSPRGYFTMQPRVAGVLSDSHRAGTPCEIFRHRANLI